MAKLRNEAKIPTILPITHEATSPPAAKKHAPVAIPPLARRPLHGESNPSDTPNVKDACLDNVAVRAYLISIDLCRTLGLPLLSAITATAKTHVLTFYKIDKTPALQHFRARRPNVHSFREKEIP